MVFEPQKEVSAKQAEVWDYIVNHVCEHGFQPTAVDMAEHFKVTPAAVRERVTHLVRKGLLGLGARGTERSLDLMGLKFEPVIDSAAIDGLPVLTEQEAETWVAVVDFVADNGFQPSFKELGGLLGVSQVTVTARMEGVVAKGHAGFSLRPEGDPNRRQTKERAMRLTGVRFRVAPSPGDEGASGRERAWA
jgi:Mn-dependent DtxR family transcriptional regulator